MLPETAIPFRIEEGLVIPTFLDETDHGWVAGLMADIDGYRGKPMATLRERLRQGFPNGTPTWKARAARVVLLRLWKAEQGTSLDPPTVRSALFSAAVKTGSRGEAIAEAAAALFTDGKTLLSALFADLPDERLLSAPEVIPTPGEIVLRTNQLIAKSLLFHARRVRIRVEGSPRPLVRQAKLRGLLCNVRDGEPPILDISGPFSLFRHTLLYGRALGDLLRFLAGCPRFGLRASCVLRGQTADLTLSRRDPIFPDEAPGSLESKLEARFAKDLRKVAPDWELWPEPEAIPVGGTLLFPDFQLRHRSDPSRAIGVEILGYWTPDFVACKVALLDESGHRDIVVCVDTALATGKGDPPPSPRVVMFHNRIPPLAVIAAANVGPTTRIGTNPRP